MLQHDFIKRLVTSALLVTLFVFLFFYFPTCVFSWCLLIILGYVLLAEWPQLCHPRLLWLLTPVYPVLPFIILIYLNHSYHAHFGMLVFLVALGDTAAYIVGKLWGKHRIAPTISPGKTWQGVGAGLCTALASTMILQRVSQVYLFSTFAVVCIYIAAIIGDLFESWLKRRVGLKDSGNILPGHGGFLDRFDALLFGGVVVMLFL